MKLRVSVGVLFVITWLAGQAVAEKSIHLYLPDGQLSSGLIKVYVTAELSPSDKPLLQLEERDALRIKPSQTDSVNASNGWSPEVVMQNAGWQERDAVKTDINVNFGTLLVFDLRSEIGFPWWAPGEKIRPVLRWTTNGDSALAFAVGDPVYLGNSTGAFIWTAVFVTLMLIVFYGLVARKEGESRNPLHALSRYVENADGRLSLALMQMALWTLAVGSLVLGFAMMHVRVPHIPSTLIILMGSSAATGLAGHWQVKRGQPSIDKADDENKQGTGVEGGNGNNGTRRGKLVDLIDIRSVDGKERASLAKAQLLFWTLLAVGVFILKSLYDKELWDVNAQLVWLMGISQVSFLGREELEEYWRGKKNGDTASSGDQSGKQGTKTGAAAPATTAAAGAAPAAPPAAPGAAPAAPPATPAAPPAAPEEPPAPTGTTTETPDE
jgi:hypothetical protein